MRKHLQIDKKTFNREKKNQNFISDFLINPTTDHKPNELSSYRKKHPYVVEWQIPEGEALNNISNAYKDI
jgi:hypothetical protein